MHIQDRLSAAQDGQVFANLARAFHLPVAKVEVAVGSMVGGLIDHMRRRVQPRRSLAAIVELLGEGTHEQVLGTPTRLSQTSTQVIGNDALSVIAGRAESKALVRHAASVAGISEMIAEYLLPVVAAMFVGDLAKTSRAGLQNLLGPAADASGPGEAPAPNEATPVPLQLPRASGGGGFTGSTSGLVSLATPASAESRYFELAEAIRRAETVPDAPDPAVSTRRVLVEILGVRDGPFVWIHRVRTWSIGALKATLGKLQR